MCIHLVWTETESNLGEIRILTPDFCYKRKSPILPNYLSPEDDGLESNLSSERFTTQEESVEWLGSGNYRLRTSPLSWQWRTTTGERTPPLRGVYASTLPLSFLSTIGGRNLWHLKKQLPFPPNPYQIINRRVSTPYVIIVHKKPQEHLPCVSLTNGSFWFFFFLLPMK